MTASHTPVAEHAAPDTASRRLGMGRFAAGAVAGIVAALAVVAIVAVVRGDGFVGEQADVAGQGGAEPMLATDGAELVRDAGGLHAFVDVPTPQPGSYEYPTGDMVPEGTPPHPDITPGNGDIPEVFTLWMFVFNRPDLCTDDVCDMDDFGPDAAARGVVYQVDGRVATEDRLVMRGTVRIGQPTSSGMTLENPLGAEVHLAIAPHGRALEGGDLNEQLNRGVGNPALWWAATFQR